MGRRGPGGQKPRRANVARYPNGRIDYRRTIADDPIPPAVHASVQRLRRVGSKLADEVIEALRRGQSRKGRSAKTQVENLMRDAVEEAKDPRLGYLLGVLWAQDVLCPPKPGRTETDEEKDERYACAARLDKAGRIYAAQHFLVWGGVSPRTAVPSNLAKMVVDVWDPGSAPPADIELPADFEKKLAAAQRQLAGARRALSRAWPGNVALQAVDRVCLDQTISEPATPPAGGNRTWRTPHVVDIAMPPLRAGLEVLAAHYEIHPAKRQRRTQTCPQAPLEQTDEPMQRVVVRSKRRRMPAAFGPHSPERPGADAVSHAVSKLRRRIAGENDEAGTPAPIRTGAP
jgi:hypothetical protein